MLDSSTVRTPASEVGNVGSNPTQAANKGK